ncbi:MAG: serine/threonine protein kinase, partial [Anaerolinea sp.]|nr:serine/threonine protein kinase [Anaerolinea sp.]
MDRDKRLVLAILVVIGIGVYLAGIAVRTAAERTRLLIPTVAILPTEAPTFTPSPSFTPMPTEAPTATIPPTEIPTEVPPTVTEAPPTAIPTDSPPTHMAADSAISLPTDVLQQTAAALAL